MITDFLWALKPLAKVAPSQPIHNNSLFAILSKVLGEGQPEGKVWLLVYDLKSLLQYLSHTLVEFSVYVMM